LADADVLVAKAAISDAKAQQQQESATLDFHTLTAPYDAMVTARQKELGCALGAGESVFTLIDPKTVWEPEFEQFTMDARSAEFAQLTANSGPPWPTARFQRQ